MSGALERDSRLGRQWKRMALIKRYRRDKRYDCLIIHCYRRSILFFIFLYFQQATWIVPSYKVTKFSHTVMKNIFILLMMCIKMEVIFSHFWCYHRNMSLVGKPRSTTLANQKALVITTGMFSSNKWISQILEGLFSFGVPLTPNQCLAQWSALKTLLSSCETAWCYQHQNQFILVDSSSHRALTV